MSKSKSRGRKGRSQSPPQRRRPVPADEEFFSGLRPATDAELRAAGIGWPDEDLELEHELEPPQVPLKDHAP